MTTVKIDLPDEQAAVLRAKAAAQGLTLERWIRKLADQEAPPKMRYNLSELVRQCNMQAAPSAEDQEWLDAPAEGREAL
jgi:antitoxin component of MazEF toxin-antitoxin module